MSINNYGFTRQTIDEIVSDLSAKLKTQIGNISLDPSNLIYQWLKIVAAREVELQSLIELTIANMTPQGSSGTFLDYHLLMAGLRRKGAEYAVGNIQLTNTVAAENQEINIGTTFSTTDAIDYVTIEPGVFDSKIRLTHTSDSYDIIPTRYYKLTPNTVYGPWGQATIDSTTTTTITITSLLDDVADSGTIYIINTGTSPYTFTPYTYDSGGYDSSTGIFTVNENPSGETGTIYYPTTNTMDAYWSGGLYSTGLTEKDSLYYLNNTYNKITFVHTNISVGASYYFMCDVPMTISVLIRAYNSGASSNTGANTITVNKNNVYTTFLTSQTNHVGISNGRDYELDSIARRRVIEAKNRHFTIDSIKDMINNIQGVRDCKVSQKINCDLIYPADWISDATFEDPSPTTGYKFTGDHEIIRLKFTTSSYIASIKGLKINAYYIGTPPNLIFQLTKTPNVWVSDSNSVLHQVTLSRGNMKDGAGIAQDVVVNLKFEGLESHTLYYINIFPSDSSSITTSDYWVLGTQTETDTTDGVAKEIGTANVVTVTDTTTIDIKYNGVVNISTANYLLIGDEILAINSVTPSGSNYTIDLTDPLTGTYYAGDVVMFYTTATITPDDIAFKTMYGIPAINVSIIPEDGYNFDIDLKEDIENMLDWEGGGGYCPLGVEYSVTEAQSGTMDLDMQIGYVGNYTLSNISSLIEESMNNYLSTLNPGDDIVYSQIEKTILMTDGVWKVKGLKITVTIGATTYESLDTDEVDIVIDEGEYIKLGEVSLSKL